MSENNEVNEAMTVVQGVVIPILKIIDNVLINSPHLVGVMTRQLEGMREETESFDGFDIEASKLKYTDEVFDSILKTVRKRQEELANLQHNNKPEEKDEG